MRIPVRLVRLVRNDGALVLGWDAAGDVVSRSQARRRRLNCLSAAVSNSRGQNGTLLDFIQGQYGSAGPRAVQPHEQAAAAISWLERNVAFAWSESSVA